MFRHHSWLRERPPRLLSVISVWIFRPKSWKWLSECWSLQVQEMSLVGHDFVCCANRVLCLGIPLIYWCRRLSGTTYVLEDAASSQHNAYPDHHQPGLKYDRSGPVPILLVPQPSDDPYDPLVCANWTSLLTRSSFLIHITHRLGHYGNATWF